MAWCVAGLVERTLYGETWERVTDMQDEQVEAYIDLMELKDRSNREYKLADSADMLGADSLHSDVTANTTAAQRREGG